jgi:hypothetical protein
VFDFKLLVLVMIDLRGLIEMGKLFVGLIVESFIVLFLGLEDTDSITYCLIFFFGLVDLVVEGGDCCGGGLLDGGEGGFKGLELF